MEKYVEIMNGINNEINNFNSLLDSNYQFNTLPIDEIHNEKYFTDIINVPWKKQDWSIYAKSGVYFFFGYRKDNPEKLGVYIGKASFSDHIGNRLDNHFRYYDKEIGYKKTSYIIELFGHVSFNDEKIKCMTPALEEHLITLLKYEYNLINIIGNK